MISVMPFFRRAKILRKRHKSAEGCLKKTGASKLTGGDATGIMETWNETGFLCSCKEEQERI